MGLFGYEQKQQLENTRTLNCLSRGKLPSPIAPFRGPKLMISIWTNVSWKEMPKTALQESQSKNGFPGSKSSSNIFSLQSRENLKRANTEYLLIIFNHLVDILNHDTDLKYFWWVKRAVILVWYELNPPFLNLSQKNKFGSGLGYGRKENVPSPQLPSIYISGFRSHSGEWRFFPRGSCPVFPKKEKDRSLIWPGFQK